MRVCMHPGVCVSVSVHVSKCVFVCVCMHPGVCVSLSVHVSKCVYVCVRVCVGRCVLVFVCKRVYSELILHFNLT